MPKGCSSAAAPRCPPTIASSRSTRKPEPCFGSRQANIFGTWLGYSKQNDILLQAGAKASDRLASEVGDGMIAYRGGDGGILWQDLKNKYTGPCILHNDLIFTGANSYANSNGVLNLKDGKPHLVRNPLTGKMEPWRINRTYGCNTVVASENLLTYRSGAAGFYDLETMSGTANLGGFKSGCTSNLVVANGVLNAPDYTRTCTCSYQNQTSLALVHMPEIEMWTYSQFGLDGKDGERIQRVGINFGAPGDRRAPDGTLWLEYPDYRRRHLARTRHRDQGRQGRLVSPPLLADHRHVTSVGGCVRIHRSRRDHHPPRAPERGAEEAADIQEEERRR